MQRGRAEDNPRNPTRRSEPALPGEDRPTGEQGGKPQEQQDKPKPALRDRLREHWVLSTVGVCVLLIAAVGGLLYWLSVRDYEWTDDAFFAVRCFLVFLFFFFFFFVVFENENL